MVISEVKKHKCTQCVKCRNSKGVTTSTVSTTLTIGNSSVTILPSRNLENGTPPITDRPISPLVSPGRDLLAELELCALQEKIDYEDLTVNSILNGSFEDVAAIMRQLDTRFDMDIISETILHFSFLICGLPVCRTEDLLLAVYLFIEDAFDIKSKIVVCSKLYESDGKMNVGVVFNSITMKYNVLKTDALLEGTEVRIKDNKDITWISRELSRSGPMC